MNSKIKYLLDNNPLWKYPNEKYLNYITPYSIANIIINEAVPYFNLDDKVVWDMFAGIGTDSIRLSARTGKVICSEIDTKTYKCFVDNIKGFNINNIISYNEDCSIAEHKVDIVYFDPPWGSEFVSGKEFSFDSVELSECTVTELMAKMYSMYPMIIKAPYLCNTVEKVVNEYDIMRIFTFSQQKVKFYFTKKKTIQ
uniref:TRM5/TYW2-like methyltransferase domain-containing protein n=1 Tax=viral metagenome TaxID=1070528 RepID=A0A6C0J8S8_9ZZZZ